MRAPIASFDDDATLRELLRDVLELEGCSVVVCSSLMELHQAAVRGAMLAIVDGWGSGHLTLGDIERQQIINLARLVPTVLMSGRTWAAKVTAGELGLVALLPKPTSKRCWISCAPASALMITRPPGSPWRCRRHRRSASRFDTAGRCSRPTAHVIFTRLFLD